MGGAACLTAVTELVAERVINKHHPHTYRRLNVNLISFNGQGKGAFGPSNRGCVKNPTFSKCIADNSRDKFPNAAFITETICILISFIVFLKV